MDRRDALLKLSGLTGFPLVLAGCNMDAVRRAEGNLGWRMSRPGTGVQFSGIPEVVKVLILATYPATPQQSQVAEQRARKAVATIAHAHRKATSSAKPKAHEVAAHGAKTHKPEPHEVVVQGSSAHKKPEAHEAATHEAKVAHVALQEPAAPAVDDTKAAAAILQQQSGTPNIAVDTTRATQAQGTRTVMLWNTKTERFVGNNVYDISSPPAKGQVAQWGSTTARYVGTGDGSL